MYGSRQVEVKESSDLDEFKAHQVGSLRKFKSIASGFGSFRRNNDSSAGPIFVHVLLGHDRKKNFFLSCESTCLPWISTRTTDWSNNFWRQVAIFVQALSEYLLNKYKKTPQQLVDSPQGTIKKVCRLNTKKTCTLPPLTCELGLNQSPFNVREGL